MNCTRPANERRIAHFLTRDPARIGPGELTTPGSIFRQHTATQDDPQSIQGTFVQLGHTTLGDPEPGRDVNKRHMVIIMQRENYLFALVQLPQPFDYGSPQLFLLQFGISVRWCLRAGERFPTEKETKT